MAREPRAFKASPAEEALPPWTFHHKQGSALLVGPVGHLTIQGGGFLFWPKLFVLLPNVRNKLVLL
jgi:hypothetical protein